MTFVKNTYSTEIILQILSDCPLFSGIPTEGLMLLLADYRQLHFSAGEILSHEGERVKACPLVISGEIEVFRYTFPGDEKVFGIFSARTVVAIAAIFMPHQRFPMNLRGKSCGEALLLHKNALLSLCRLYPPLMERLLTQFSMKLYDNVNNIDWLTSSSAEQRLAACLVKLSQQQQSQQLLLPFSRHQLAAQLGIRYETLSRLFSRWRSLRIISIQKNQITVQQPEYLHELTIPAQRQF